MYFIVQNSVQPLFLVISIVADAKLPVVSRQLSNWEPPANTSEQMVAWFNGIDAGLWLADF